MSAPAVCIGNGTCDPRIPHVCYNGVELDEPWLDAR